MKASRGMGAINPSKMPKGTKKARRDDTDFTQYAKGGELKEVPNDNKGLGKLPTDVRNKMGYMKTGGLYENINAKRKRIAAGSGEKMRKAGAKGAPSAMDFVNSAKTAKKRK
jgi:hypothetical protein